MTRKQYLNTLQRGVTLLELSVVLLILVALAGLAVPYVGGIGSTASCQTTDATMHAVKEAIMGGAAGAGFYTDTLGRYPSPQSNPTSFSLTYLFEQGGWQSYNSKTGVGWRGPYLMNGGMSPGGLDTSFSSVYALANPTGKVHADITINTQVFDGWHRPIVLQIPYDTDHNSLSYNYARLVSAGAGNGINPGDAVIDTKIAYSSATTPLPTASDRGDDRVLYLKYPDPSVDGNTPCD